MSYTLIARLVPRANQGFDIEGRGTITLSNQTAKALPEVPLHLYMNAFRDAESLAGRSPFYQGRAAQSGGRGSIDISSFVDERNGQRLSPVFPATDPDQTTASVVLPAPVPPGERVTFGIEWVVHLPELHQRTGYADDFVFAGQWFPKLAKLEPDGSWMQFPFHPQAEFYANFGDYDVTLEVPPGYRIGASGALAEPTDGALHTQRFVARRVHDFAWTAWPKFNEHRERIGATEVLLLTPPGHDRNREVTLETLRKTLPWFGSWLGAYPYPTLTVVHPPPYAEGAGGMEYPGLLTTGGHVWDGYLSADIERVVAHELAHQWFYGVVASNEHAYPFLDEGLSTYAENRSIETLFTSKTDATWRQWKHWQQRLWSNHYGRDVAASTAATEFPSFSHLAGVAYDRTALLLETFHHTQPHFDDSITRYVERYRYAHPTPRDFVATIDETLSDTARRTLSAGLFERGTLNFRVSDLTSVRSASGEGYLSRVFITRQGSLVFPVDIDVWENGSPRRQVWHGEGEVYTLELTTRSPIEAVCLDVDQKLAIEESRLDNCVKQRASRAPRYWGLVLGWLGLLLSLVGW